MDLQQTERLLRLLIFICLSGLQAVLATAATTDATGISKAQNTTEAPIDVTVTHSYPLGNTDGSKTAADDRTTAAAATTVTTASASSQTNSAGAMMTTTPAKTTDADISSAYKWSNDRSTVAEGGGGQGGGGGGGGTTANATASSMTVAGNQTARATTSPTVSPILCYNCSGDNCKNLSSDNSSACISNTGICYIQYNTSSMAMTLACKPLHAPSGICSSDYASQAAKTNCEFCCTTNRCNSKTSTEIKQKCQQLLQSSASQHFGFSAILLTLIAAIRLPFFSSDITTY